MKGILYFLAFLAISNGNSDLIDDEYIPSESYRIPYKINISHQVVKAKKPLKGFPFASSKFGNKGQARIVNGNRASTNEFPYQVSVRAISVSNASLCGGSIVSSRHILTAAHCTRGYSRFEIGFGSALLNSPLIKMTSFNKKEHPNFNPTLLRNDIALIKLPSDIPFSTSISPVQLPPKSDASVTYLNKTAIVSGFGRISDESVQVSGNLNFVKMRIIGNSDCSAIYGSKIVTRDLICGKGFERSNQNACQGDSGGPLTTEDTDGKVIQIGIVSFVSSRGCTFGDPSGYTKVAKYLQWISKETFVSS